jgi:hypothetical protein
MQGGETVGDKRETSTHNFHRLLWANIPSAPTIAVLSYPCPVSSTFRVDAETTHWKIMNEFSSDIPAVDPRSLAVMLMVCERAGAVKEK